MTKMDVHARNALFARYYYLCARGAHKFYRRPLDRSDLQQIAAIGLIKACDRYDERLRTPFEAYAWLFVVGELMHYVRDQERIVRPPRRIRSLEKHYLHAHETLIAELGREPTLAEIAQRLKVRVSDVQDVCSYRTQALSESLDDVEPAKLQRWSYTIEGREDCLLVESALKRLTPVERTVIVGVYARGYSQQEISKKLGFSRRHVSRLHGSALRKLRLSAAV
jgi:RNA polymerase sigma-B factor